MKKSLWVFAVIAMVVFNGCAKLYTDVETNDYAELELLPNSKTLLFADMYSAHIRDMSKGCDNMENLGMVYTDSDTPKSVKIPAGKPLYIRVNYQLLQGNNEYNEYMDFVLTAEKHEHYVVEYDKEEVDGKTETNYSVYMLQGSKAVEIPKKSIHEFNSRECS